MQRVTKPEDRKEGTRRFFIAVDNIELGFSCMDDDEETKEVCGPQCRNGIDADRGFKKALWLDILKECNFMAHLHGRAVTTGRRQLSHTKPGVRIGDYRN